MLNELITWVLNTYLGKYLENFNPAQLSIALVSGEVELENVPIRRDALRSFGIPVEALSGSIGRIKLQIPVRQFRTSPWSIVIERVYGVFGPKNLDEWDNDKEMEAEYAYKVRVLDAKEANWRVENGCKTESYYSLSYSNWINYGTSIATNILENLELTIKDVHLRYEDPLTMPDLQHAAGIRINSISAQSCDCNWVPSSKNSDKQKVSFKILELNDFRLYWDKLHLKNVCGSVNSKELLEKMNELCNFDHHNFLTNSINATLKFKRERCKQPLRSKTRPRVSCDVLFHQVNLSLSDIQYTEIVRCLNELQNITQKREFKILRPLTPISVDPKLWWKYAAMCHGYTICSSYEKIELARENIKYMLIYKRLLINPSENLAKEERHFKINIEKRRSLDNLKLLRKVCCDYVCSKGMNTRQRTIVQGRNILYHWFPNWLGWYGVSDNTIGEDAAVVNDDTYKHIENDILCALKESIENEAFSKRDVIFGNFTFTLSDVKIALKTVKFQRELTMLDMELTNLFCFIEIKPKLTSYRVGLSLGSVHLNDKLTHSTEFPYLIKPQNQGTTNPKSFYTEFLSFFSKRDATHASEEPWFQLQYERNPPEHHSDYRLIIKSKSLDIVYNEIALKWLVTFLIQPIKDIKNIKTVTLATKEKEISRLKFFRHWKSVLVGQKDNRKKWSFEIDISAPRIICVENFKDKNTSVVIIDFGRFHLFKNERSPADFQVANVDISEVDSDEELFMTPCSTPPGSKTSLSDIPVLNPTTGDDHLFSRFVINNDTGLESDAHNEIYDKYIINLTDLQILVCKNRECVFACAKSSSCYHLLDKFNINLHLERRIVITTDPEYPSFTLFGNLNRIVAHINEQKISECLKILNPITFDLFNSVENSKLDEKNIESDFEAIHSGNTTIIQFIIDQIILEIQSREKSIAEIQVIGAKAGVTRKSDAVNISMSVHGFLLVDAIQSFGPDFELLIASHRHVEMDSKSGSIRQSEPCSPTSPGSPDPNGHQRCASPNIINRALNDLQTGLDSKFDEENALITVDLSFIHSSEELDSMQIANITFNNLDVIANQETIVEILGFVKRIVDNYRLVRNVSTKNNQPSDIAQPTDPGLICKMKSEISFDFHRLNILVFRSTRLDSLNIGRKVGTLTMSEAKIHASIGNEFSVSGALGGIQIVDITPEGFNHQRIFSVGKDPLTDPPSLFTNDILFTLTNEMYGNDIDDDNSYLNALSFKITHSKSSQIVAKIRMASVWYTHCPRFIEEIYLCVKEFKQYFKNFVKSIRNKASNMAKGLAHHIGSRNVENSFSKFGEISLDIILSTPVLVLPRSCQSNEVLVANLGKFTVCNKQENYVQTNPTEHSKRITYFIDVRNINLFSLNTQKRKKSALPKANEIYSCQEDAVPILHNTALLFQFVYESKSLLPQNSIEDTILVDGSVTQNLHVSLSKYQYEQLIESLNYATNIVLAEGFFTSNEDERYLEVRENLCAKKSSNIQVISVQFSVPILKFDLRNEHRVSLIQLTFQEFSFKNINIAGKKKEFEILLRSVIMEDLKCPVASKYRKMINSCNDMNELQFTFRNQKSSSCSDLLKKTNLCACKVYGSTPSNLNKLVKPSIIKREEKFKTLKVLDDINLNNQKISADNLVIYRSTASYSPRKEDIAAIRSSIDFNCLNLIISIDKWFMVFDFFGLITSHREQEEPSIKSNENDKSSSSKELLVTIRSLNLILVRNESELAKANVSNVKLHINRDLYMQSIDGRLGSISIYDLTPYGHLYQEKFSTSGMEALSFTYKRDKAEALSSCRTLESDALLSINMSSVKYVHTKRFLIELQLFVKELIQLQSPVMNRIKNNNTRKRNRNNKSQQIGLEVNADSPIILLPVSFNSNHMLIADLGKITLRNCFKFSDDLVPLNTSQPTPSLRKEIIDVMHVDLVNINLLTGEREPNNSACNSSKNSNVLHIGNFCIIKLGGTIFKEKCYLKIQIMRNTEADVSHNSPDITVKGTLSELNGLINLQQYKLIRGFLNYNLGESIDDVYYNYEMNLNESLEILSSISKVNVLEKQSIVWNTLSINFILDNVTVYLADPQTTQNCMGMSTNLACIKFVKSNLEIDSFSDGSQDIDLISREILLMDARDNDSFLTEHNCFKRILEPTQNKTCQNTVQVEIHSRRRGGFSKYTILLNNMRIMALLDYLERLKNFLNEEPYMSGALEKSDKSDTRISVSTTPVQQHATTRGSPSSNDCSKYEFVLNITNSEIVFVENRSQHDSNAIILKSTTVFSYKPNSSVVPISIDINHLEIFSCILGFENESSLSIIDPFTLNIELRNSCFQISVQSQIFLRVSYNDVMLFLRLMESIPKQTVKNASHIKVSDDAEKIAPLLTMGFKPDECSLAMQISNNNINEAAIWLSQQKRKKSNNGINITRIALNANILSICIIDDCLDADVPLLEISLSQLKILQKFDSLNEENLGRCYEGNVETVISSNYYNRRLSGWEPIIEAWDSSGNWKFCKSNADHSKSLHIHINSKQILKFNITTTIVELCELVRKNWTEDYFLRICSNENINIRKRNPFVPFALKNLTGEPLIFKTFFSHAGGITRTEVTQELLMCDWISAQHNETVSFDFGPQSKLRHLDSHKLNMHQILVQIHGWTLIGPISIDKVGIFFRYANLDMQYSKKTRIVFEISLIGSAQKLITVRSALNAENNTRKKIFLHLKLRQENEIGVMSINPAEKINIPLRYVDSLIFLKPYIETDPMNKIYDLLKNEENGSFRKYYLQQFEESGFCTRSISWLNCITQDSVQDIHSCFLPNKLPFFIISDIIKDKYPLRDTGAMPGHTIRILPPLKLKNLLCCDILYKISDHAEGRIDAAKEIEIYSIDIKESFCLSITLDNYRLSGQIKIPMGHSGIVEPKFKLIDILNRELYLRVSIQSFQGKGIEIYIGAPIWIVNKTGLPLIFRQEGTIQPASGQFVEHEHARETSPLMFSFSDQEGPPLLEFRLGKSYGDNNPWCSSFGIHKENTFRELKAENSKTNYVIGVNVQRGKGLYLTTTFITLTPRFQLYNRSSRELQFAQKCDITKQMTNTPKSLISALPGSNFPFHWTNCEHEPLLCVRVADNDYCHWSKGLPVNETKSLYINLRNDIGEMIFLRLEVILHGGTYILHFTDAHTLPPPIRIDNYSEVNIHFYQKDVDPFWRTCVKPLSSLAYVMDDPLAPHILRIEAPGGNSIDYPLNKMDVAKSITYANFIYIAFKETFRLVISDCDDTQVGIEGQQLVLGVKDKRVIITRKCAGDRSQLWLMNSFGQLEHEGSSPPSEYLKSSHTSPRLVLDLEKPPNPTEYTKLVVRPQNIQRVTTQTWRFENGRLMCHANMCVQAANGIYGLKPGCDAVLGRIESTSRAVNENRIPLEQCIEIQKLRPGSGHLEILSKMDGPIKTLQIHDVKSNLDELILAADPCWKHASVFNKMFVEDTKNYGFAEIVIKLNLLKGLGLSIITRAPCEELAYLTFEGIMVHIVLSPITKSLDLNVCDFQIDNQLLETTCPIMYYVTKSSTENAPRDAITCKAKVLPSPNKNAVIFEHLSVHIKPCAILLEERLILKMALFLGYGKTNNNFTHQTESMVYRFDEYPFSKNAKRYYFENLILGATQVRLTVLTAPKLTPELFEIKKILGLTLIKFEDAIIEFDKFSDRHHFETFDTYLKAVKMHYVNQIKWHAASILGSVDFLGNPLGFANDLSEGVSGLIFEGSVKSLVKNVTHGISNSTAKLTETISHSLGKVVLDERDNETRQKILEVSYPTTGGHLAAGLKGFGFGLLGGVTSIVRHTYIGAQSDGFPGFISGLGKGLVGTVTKPLIGVLDLASETASAVRETSRGSHHFLPDRKRLPRCVTGAPGGLLPNYSYRQSKGQQYLYIINRRNFSEKLIFYEPNLCNDKEAKLRLLVSTEFIRIFSRCEEDPAIMIECHLSEVLSCHPLTTSTNVLSSTKIVPVYYIEISTNLPKVTRPRVRCQNENVAERASRCINYAKAIFDEREHSLIHT